MSKDADVRINETVDAILKLLPDTGRGLKDAIQTALTRDYSAGPRRQALSDLLSLGGFHIGGGKRRTLERIYLLTQRVLHGLTDQQMTTAKKIADSLNEQQLQVLLQGEAKTYAGTPPAGTVDLAESFGYAPDPILAREKVLTSVVKAKRLLAQMHNGVMSAGAGGVHRARYETWFGAFDADRHRIVSKNLNDVSHALITRPLKIYYRGKGVNGKPVDKPGAEYHNPYTTLREAKGEYGCFVPGFPGGGVEADRIHIQLGCAFFDSTQDVSDASKVELMSSAGVIIHELLHAICGADDKKNKLGETLYGPRKCKAEAIARPEFTVANADSYRLFGDTYDSKTA